MRQRRKPGPRFRRAKSVHLCSRCGGGVEPGDRYVYVAFGRFFNPVSYLISRGHVAEMKAHEACFKRDFPNEYVYLVEVGP